MLQTNPGNAGSQDEVRQPRQCRLAGAQMCVERLPPQDIIVRNISSRGAGAASRGQPPLADETVSIRFANGQSIVGVVKWVDGQSFGIELSRDIDIPALANSLQRVHEKTNAAANWEV